ncbi:MAG: NAD(P)H-dependent oxidoreductase [Candidatus Saccharimonadales bacterium]
MPSKKIAVIISTTRPSRIGADIADWFIRNVSDMPNAKFELIDLKEINLPFFDEVYSPAKGIYQKDHTKKWKALIDSFDGYVFVTAEYNAGYPAPLKNAIDYLDSEWHNKPAAIVSYGWTAGASASAQLKQVLERLKMQITGVSPGLTFNGDTFNEAGRLADVDASFAENLDEIKMATTQLLELVDLTD